jgi:uncharacterized membrane protein HdeD (DUF308 family)
MSPILHPVADTFLLGFIACCSLVAVLFFLRFWRATHDFLFLAFAIFFLGQGASYTLALLFSHPNEGSPYLFLLRLLSVLVLLAAILRKNAGKG